MTRSTRSTTRTVAQRRTKPEHRDRSTAEPPSRPTAPRQPAQRRPRTQRSVKDRDGRNGVPDQPAAPIDRNSGIGASEAAAACGLSPYEQTVELYLQKVGQLTDPAETEAMLFGRCIEAGGIEFWSRLNGVPVTYPLPIRRHARYPFILATPDAQISPTEGLEFKSLGWRVAQQIDDQGLAVACPQYVLQAQQQMAVMGWDTVRLVGLVERQLHEWRIERNERLIRLLIEREEVFWDHVQRREPPTVDFTRPGCLRAVQALFPKTRESVVRLDQRVSAQWADYEQLGRQMGDLSQRREQLKAEVLYALRDHTAGVLEDGTRMVRRKLVQRAGYEVPATEFWDVRAVKYDGSAVLETEPAIVA